MEWEDRLMVEGTITQVRPYLKLMITLKKLGLVDKGYSCVPSYVRCLIIMQEISDTYTAINVDLVQTRLIVNKQHNILKSTHV